MKKGELTTQQIVTLIILIISFVVLLYFLLAWDPVNESKKDICHNSVVRQANFLPSNLPGNLECSTEYLCISGGEDCENFYYDRKIELKEKTRDELLRLIAEEMADCWWMFGEGKVDYSGAKWPNDYDSYCAVCSAIKFDPIINKKFSYLKYSDLNIYLKNTKMKSSTQTYSEYMPFIEENYVRTAGFNDIQWDEEFMIITQIDNDGTLLSRKKPTSFTFATPPLFLEKSQDYYAKLKCNNFVTKA